jgi:hypothetical protein
MDQRWPGRTSQRGSKACHSLVQGGDVGVDRVGLVLAEARACGQAVTASVGRSCRHSRPQHTQHNAASAHRYLKLGVHTHLLGLGLHSMC